MSKEILPANESEAKKEKAKPSSIRRGIGAFVIGVTIGSSISAFVSEAVNSNDDSEQAFQGRVIEEVVEMPQEILINDKLIINESPKKEEHPLDSQGKGGGDAYIGEALAITRNSPQEYIMSIKPEAYDIEIAEPDGADPYDIRQNLSHLDEGRIEYSFVNNEIDHLIFSRPSAELLEEFASAENIESTTNAMVKYFKGLGIKFTNDSRKYEVHEGSNYPPLEEEDLKEYKDMMLGIMNGFSFYPNQLIKYVGLDNIIVASDLSYVEDNKEVIPSGLFSVNEKGEYSIYIDANPNMEERGALRWSESLIAHEFAHAIERRMSQSNPYLAEEYSETLPEWFKYLNDTDTDEAQDMINKAIEEKVIWPHTIGSVTNMHEMFAGDIRNMFSHSSEGFFLPRMISSADEESYINSPLHERQKAALYLLDKAVPGMATFLEAYWQKADALIFADLWNIDNEYIKELKEFEQGNYIRYFEEDGRYQRRIENRPTMPDIVE